MGSSVSVIIPCFNQAHFLSAAIESVVRQSHRNLEIIVVDDGSTDETAAVAAAYPQVKLIRQSNRGVAVARNRGLRESVGEFLVFLDADDLLLQDALRVGLDSLAAHPSAAFVYGYGQFINAASEPLRTPRQPRVRRNHYRQLLRRNYIWSVGAAMFRRAVVDGFRAGVDGCADWDLFLRIVRQHKIHCHGKIVFQYRRHDANMSGNGELMAQATLDLFRSQLEEVRGNRKLERLCLRQISQSETWLAGGRDSWGEALNRVTQMIRLRTRLRTLAGAVRRMT